MKRVKSHLGENNLDRYFKYGHLIKKLTINIYCNEYNSDKFSKPELLALLSQLPKLNEFCIRDIKYAEHYLSILLNADMKHMNKIDIGNFERDSSESGPHDMYFFVNYKLRNTISSLHLLYNKSTICFESQQIDILNSLTHFKQLTELYFHNKHDMNLTLFHIQNMSPHLKQLIFVSDYSVPESMILDPSSNNIKIDLKFITSLRHLELHLPSLSAAYTRYLIDYFPDQCIQLIIKISEQTLIGWINIVGMELALKLLEKWVELKYQAFSLEKMSDMYHKPTLNPK